MIVQTKMVQSKSVLEEGIVVHSQLQSARASHKNVHASATVKAASTARAHPCFWVKAALCL